VGNLVAVFTDVDANAHSALASRSPPTPSRLLRASRQGPRAILTACVLLFTSPSSLIVQARRFVRFVICVRDRIWALSRLVLAGYVSAALAFCSS